MNLNDALNELTPEEKEVMKKASLSDWITAITSCITDVCTFTRCAR